MTIHYHEPAAELSPETRDIHRAISTIVEEWEAIDWYNQRMDIAKDEELRRILEHNRNEEMEHAMMANEWLRRRLPELDETMRTFLFTTQSIVDIEHEEKAESNGGADGGRTQHGDLGIGKITTR